MKKNHIKRLALSAVLLAIGLVLPFLTGQIPEIGSMLLPLHLPALICGFVCGWPWGLAVGFILPNGQADAAPDALWQMLTERAQAARKK